MCINMTYSTHTHCQVKQGNSCHMILITTINHNSQCELHTSVYTIDNACIYLCYNLLICSQSYLLATLPLTTTSLDHISSQLSPNYTQDVVAPNIIDNRDLPYTLPLLTEECIWLPRLRQHTPCLPRRPCQWLSAGSRTAVWWEDSFLLPSLPASHGN